MKSARLDADAVRADANGKWPSILAACGIDQGYLGRKNGPCPICQEGRDRYKFDDKDGRGTWLCSQCGAGDGFALLQKVKGWTFPEALQEVAALASSVRPVRVRMGRSEAEVRAEMRAIWASARPLAEVIATELWWVRRVGEVPACKDLRGSPRLRCQGAAEHPAMLAIVRDAAGKPVNLHRTYLTDTGEKADVESPRRVMDLTLPDGCAVRLAEPVDGVLGVAEGIETAQACNLLFGLPTWALLNAANMRKFTPPVGVSRLIVFGDCDESFTGQAAAFELARKCWAIRNKREPRLAVEVRIHGMSVDPGAWGHDWNDALQSRLSERAA